MKQKMIFKLMFAVKITTLSKHDGDMKKHGSGSIMIWVWNWNLSQREKYNQKFPLSILNLLTKLHALAKQLKILSTMMT